VTRGKSDCWLLLDAARGGLLLKIHMPSGCVVRASQAASSSVQLAATGSGSRCFRRTSDENNSSDRFARSALLSSRNV
jgi:hypothetical protein